MTGFVDADEETVDEDGAGLGVAAFDGLGEVDAEPGLESDEAKEGAAPSLV